MQRFCVHICILKTDCLVSICCYFFKVIFIRILVKSVTTFLECFVGVHINYALWVFIVTVLHFVFLFPFVEDGWICIYFILVTNVCKYDFGSGPVACVMFINVKAQENRQCLTCLKHLSQF
jgi:hypothetical protein